MVVGRLRRQSIQMDDVNTEISPGFKTVTVPTAENVSIPVPGHVELVVFG
jgi:hypothetical protein